MKPENIKRKLGELSEKAGKAGSHVPAWFQVHGKVSAAAGALAVVVVVLAVMSGSGGGGEGAGGAGAGGVNGERAVGEGAGGVIGERAAGEGAGGAGAGGMMGERAAGEGAGGAGAGGVIGERAAGEGTAGSGGGGRNTGRNPGEASPDLDGEGENAGNSRIQGLNRGERRMQGPELEQDQKELLDGLAKVLESRNLEAGGTMLLDHEMKLEYLFYQTMKGETYLYRDGGLYRDLEGEGLVLTRPMAAYYGSLKNGVPEGWGAAIQGIELDGLRYDYAEGLWSEGKLNGEATAGYHYYEGNGEGESRAVKRTGVFVDDVMEGAFTYETVSADGEVTVWDMVAEAGKTKLDERWIHEDEKQYYYLPSRDISNHTYVIADSQVEDIRWRNMLPWNQ